MYTIDLVGKQIQTQDFEKHSKYGTDPEMYTEIRESVPQCPKLWDLKHKCLTDEPVVD